MLAVGALAATSPLLHAQQLAANQVNQLKQLSIEQLTNVMVTSVTRGPEPLSRSAAAVALVTSGEIESSGAMNVPEAIRYVPGNIILTLSLEGDSLLHSSHIEFGGPDERSAIKRSVFGRLTWDL